MRRRRRPRRATVTGLAIAAFIVVNVVGAVADWPAPLVVGVASIAACIAVAPLLRGR